MESRLFGTFRRDILIVFICFSAPVFGQDNVQFFVNPYSFNPSYAGVEGRPSFYLSYRRQWINVDGSPQTGNLSFHTPLKKFVSFGANINNDKRGLFNTTTGLISGAYTVMLGDFKSMRFGISAGAGVSSLDLSNVDDNQDPALLNGGNSFIQGNAGISFHIKSFHGGIALPTLFETSNISGGASTLNPLQSVVVHASNRFYWNKNKTLLEPHLIYRYNAVVPSQFEMALVYHVNEAIWAGGSYKQRMGTSAFMGLHFNKALGLGYSYTFKMETGSELNSPSHEIQLTLLLGTKRKDIPFYSFVDTDKEKRVQHHKQTTHQSASAVVAQNREKKPAEKPADKPPIDQNHQARLPETITNKPAKQPRKTEPAVTKTPVTKPAETKPAETKPAENKPVVTQTQPVTKPTTPKPEVKKLGTMPLVADTTHPAHQEEKEKIARLAEHAENPTEEHDKTADFHPHAERHEFVKRGNHQEELEIGDYVVAGVFRSKINAEHFATGLNMHGFKTGHGHLTEKNLWYVYLAHTDTVEKAKVERDKYRKMKIFRDSWLLTVHH